MSTKKAKDEIKETAVEAAVTEKEVKKKTSKKAAAAEPVAEEKPVKKEETAQLDMKVPTNNRFKYGTRTERNEHLFDIEEDVLIENNLDQEASHESDQQF